MKNLSKNKTSDEKQRVPSLSIVNQDGNPISEGTMNLTQDQVMRPQSARSKNIITKIKPDTNPAHKPEQVYIYYGDIKA